jgi:hypothetical protein
LGGNKDDALGFASGFDGPSFSPAGAVAAAWWGAADFGPWTMILLAVAAAVESLLFLLLPFAMAAATPPVATEMGSICWVKRAVRGCPAASGGGGVTTAGDAAVVAAFSGVLGVNKVGDDDEDE